MDLVLGALPTLLAEEGNWSSSAVAKPISKQAFRAAAGRSSPYRIGVSRL
jgi:hypothetical protein